MNKIRKILYPILGLLGLASLVVIIIESCSIHRRTFTIPTIEVTDETFSPPAATVETGTEPVDETEQAPAPTHTPMYTTTRLRVRQTPEITDDNIITVLPTNTLLDIIDYDPQHTWDMVVLEHEVCFVATEFLAPEPVPVQEEAAAATVPTGTYFHSYGIYSGAYWNFTPEQIDAQWSGRKPGKHYLMQGTTRGWQRYLYTYLESRGIEWFYPYAVAQAMQESGMDPLNNQEHTIVSWVGSQATYDCGLFSFKDIYWNPAYGNIFDYHANINAYVDRIAPYLEGGATENAIYAAISQHYQPYQYNASYVNAVLSHLPELWICD